MATELKLTAKKVAKSGSIEKNSSKVKVTVDVTTTGTSWNADGDTRGGVKIDGKEVGSLNGKKFYKNTTTTIYSKEHTVQHEEDGTKTAEISVSFDTKIAAGVIEAKKTVVLDPIPRASALTVPEMFYGKEAVIGIETLVSGATSDISYTFGSRNGTLAEKTNATEIAWTPELELAAEYPNSAEGDGVLRVTTYTGETVLGTRTFPFTIRADNALGPVIKMCSVEPMGSALGAYIKGVTSARFAIEAEGQQGATVTECKLAFAGQTAIGAEGITNALTAAGEQEPVFTVTDSRGVVTTEKLPAETVYDYYLPTLVVAEVYRADGDEINVNAKADFADVGGMNRVVLQLRSKESNAGWGDVYTELSAEQINVLRGFTENRSYEVGVSVTDAVGGKNAVVFSVPTAEVAFHIKDGGKGAAFGKYATEDDALDIAWKTLIVDGKTLLDWIHPVGSFFITKKDEDPNELYGGKWEKVEGKFLLASSAAYPAGTDGGEERHTLTVEEMPSHTHGLRLQEKALPGGGEDYSRISSTSNYATGIVGSAGGGESHNNMPPYLAVNVWERTE